MRRKNFIVSTLAATQQSGITLTATDLNQTLASVPHYANDAAALAVVPPLAAGTVYTVDTDAALHVI